LLFLILTSGVLFAEDNPAADNGIIEGKVVDHDTQNPVPDAVIKILSSDKKTGSDDKGYFRFNNLKNGNYVLEITAIGYKTLMKNDIVISSGNPVTVIVELNSTSFSTESINVDANYFDKNSDVNISSINLDYEEVRRSPGASEDISRMFQTAPGVSVLNDQRNDLVVRGGSPSENLLLIDGVDLPNISHYGSQGTTGGAITFLNLKFIRDAEIFTGGFNSKFGDRLSSVVDIKLREGSFKDYINNVNLSFAGFGGTFEGPVSKNTSYLFSVNRSYLDLLKGALRLSAVPNYWDFNLKLTHKIDENNILSVIGFSALDKINFVADADTKLDDFPYDSDNKTNTYTGGLVYKHLNKNGYLQAVVSNTNTNYYSNNIFAPTKKQEYYLDNNENELTSKLEYNQRISNSLFVTVNAGGRWGRYKNDIFSVQDTTAQGYVLPELKVNNSINNTKLFAGVNFTSRLIKDRLVLNYGLRFDYFDYIKNKSTLSPRVGASFYLTNTTVINAAYGIYHQAPLNIWLASDPRNAKLNSMRSDHYIAGIEQMFSKDIKFVAEVYEKRYSDYAVSVNNPDYILIDGGSDFGPNIVGYASSSGQGYIRGIDFSIQKKLTGNGLYGSINYSYSKSGFTALTGEEKQAAFDPTNQFTIILGYQVADDWLIGFKFKYAGGRPYTPFDPVISTQLGRGVWDMSKFNEERYPAYSRLDVRVDKKFYFKKVCLTTYFELQNAYNRENIYGYFWNKAKNQQATIYQWGFMPVGGFNLEF
jgi:hypothetical protein